jgi:Putative MetA-pathway of phenol degradation
MSSAITRATICLLTLLTPALAWADGTPICPDRPGRGTSACTLEAGHAQLELGLFDESFQRRSGVTTDSGSAGSLLVKWGVSDRVDVEAGMALTQFQRVHDATGTTHASGIGDLFLHAKFNPLPADGAFTLVFDPFLKLPTAGGGLGNGAVEGGLVLPMGYDLGTGWSLAMTPEADVLRNASGSGFHANLVDVMGLGKSFGRLSLGAEVWTDQNLDPAGAIREYSFDLDAAWLAAGDTQFDTGINLGLNRATPDLEIYFGISRRF